MRLGRLPHDPAAVARVPSLARHPFASMPVPPSLDRSRIDFTPGLYKNNELPDCTAAGLANSASAVAAVSGFGMAINPDLVPSFYAGCVQCEPTLEAMAATDGAAMLDVLVRQSREGFDVGQEAPLVARFGRLAPASFALAGAMARLRHCYLGIRLYEADMEMPNVWDIGPSDGSLIGGHCVVGWDFTGLASQSTVRLATWGRWQPATWRWLISRLDEAYALVWAPAPEGVDVSALDVDLASLTT